MSDVTAAIGCFPRESEAVLATVGVREGRALLLDQRRIVLVREAPAGPARDGDALAEAAARARAQRESMQRDAVRALVQLSRDLASRARVVAFVAPEPHSLAGDLELSLDAREPSLRGDPELALSALCDAAAQLRLDVFVHSPGGALEAAGMALGAMPNEVAAFVANLGAPGGPHWEADKRQAAASALIALSQSARLRLPRA